MQFESPEWPSILHRIVTVPHQISDPVLNPPTSKSPGNAWKRVLAADISAHAESCIDNDTETNHFLKLDHFGLSGVIFYRSPAKGETLEEGQMDDAVSVVASGTSTHFPTETDELERILGQTAARLVYLPNHACTSFVVGQVMNSLVHSTMCPLPAPSGFYVKSKTVSIPQQSLPGDSRTISVQDMSSYLKPTLQCAERVTKDRRRAFLLDRAIRYRAIRLRQTAQVADPIPPPPAEKPRHANHSGVADLRAVGKGDEDKQHCDVLDISILTPTATPHFAESIPSLDVEKIGSVVVLRNVLTMNTLSISAEPPTPVKHHPRNRRDNKENTSV